MAARRPSLILFARAPREGAVKTRLAPVVGAKGAARLARAFLEDAARAYGPPSGWEAIVAVEPGPDEAPFPEIFPPPWRREAQSGETLGDRLGRAFEEEFRRGAPAVAAVGSDHPALSRRRIEALFERLAAGWDACLIPAEDGGYCAIGLAAAARRAEAFREIPWSSARVLDVTRARLAAAGCRLAALAPSYDVDRPEDLARLRADLSERNPSDPDYPSSTAAALGLLPARGAL